MHIPDNYLSPSTCGTLLVATIPIWKRCTTKVKEEISRKKMPLLGIAASFSFLIMMFNVPLPGGTTGHAVGGALIAILLGPYAACISVSVALFIQALLFGDGGILAFGANAFNMAIVLPFISYYIFKLLKDKLKINNKDFIAAFIAGYIGLCIAALVASLELGIQPLLFKDVLGRPLYCPYPLSISIPAMVIPHLLIAGVIEGIVTSAVYVYVKNVAPETIYVNNTISNLNNNTKFKMKPLFMFLITVICLTPLGLLATGTAWGEWGTDEVGNMLGYVPKGMKQGFSFNSIIPDYSISRYK